MCCQISLAKSILSFLSYQPWSCKFISFLRRLFVLAYSIFESHATSLFMRLYESPVNHDEIINDAYPYVRKDEAGALVFEGSMIDKLADEDDPNSKYQVVDIVERFNLQPLDLKKAAFMAWAKQFMPMRKKQLEESMPDKVEQFMAEAKKYVAYIVGHFADFEFYMGQSGDPDDYLLAGTDEGDKKVFYFLELACDSSKC